MAAVTAPTALVTAAASGVPKSAAAAEVAVAHGATVPMATALAAALGCFYFVYLHRTGTALPDDNGRILVTTAPQAALGSLRAAFV